MAQVLQTALYVSSNAAAGTIQQTVNCVGLTALYVEVVTNATVADLRGTIDLGMGVVEASTYPNVQAGTTVTSLPATFSAVTTGRITLTDPSIGRNVGVYRIANIARLFKPTWTFTSGTGDWSVKLTVWGFGQGTTP